VVLSNIVAISLDLIDCTAAFGPFLETAKIAHVLVSQIVQGFVPASTDRPPEAQYSFVLVAA
jgi:hypothetical protein